ncbi:MAG: MFS transporter [Rickettsiales bacterium]
MIKKNKTDFGLYVLFPIFVALYETSAYLSNDMYLPALPEIRRFLGVSVEQAQDTLTMWFLGTCLFQLFVGPVSDKYGRRPILFAGAGIFVLGCLISAVAENIYLFNLGRFMQGFMVPTCLITAYAILHEYFSTQKAIQVLAWMGSIIIIGPAIGPLLGSIILMKAQWQIIFYVLIICAVIPVLVLYKVMPESQELSRDKPLNFKDIFGNYKQLVLNKQVVGYSLIFSFNIFAPIAWIVAGPFLVIETFHMSEADFGFIQLEVFGTYAAACLVVNKISTKYDPFKLLKTGHKICIISSVSAVILSYIFIDNLKVITVMLILISVGNAFVLPVANRLSVESSRLPKSYVVSFFFMVIGLSTTFTSKFISEVFDFNIQEFCYLILFVNLASQGLIILLSKSKK